MRTRFALVVGAVCVGILALNLVLFHAHWAGSASFPWDFPRAYWAATAYWIASIEAGEWPHWVPYQSMGYPFALNTQTGIFYPAFWAFPVLDQPFTLRAANALQALHVVFGAVGVFLLVSRWLESSTVGWVGAVAFHFFGGFFTNAQHPDFVRAFAWLPWILWAWLPSSRSRSLRSANLLLPFLVAAFVTGSYPGCMIAGAVGLSVFAASRELFDGEGSRFHAVAMRALLVLLGVGLAGAYWIPVADMRDELVRLEAASMIERWYLEPFDVLQLLFPSSAFDRRDWSMYGMQLPIVLFPFLAFVGWREWRRNAAFLVTAAVALFLSLGALAAYSRVVVDRVPPLGWSRFSAGEYRVFMALGVLVLCLSGIQRLRMRARIGKLELARLGVATLALVALSIAFLESFALAEMRGSVVPVIAWQVGGLAASWFALALSRGEKGRAVYFAVVLPILCVLTGYPVVRHMESAWRHDGLERILYANVPVALEGEEPASPAFADELRERPARRSAEASGDLPWRGYIDGRFLVGDKGNTVTRARAVIEQSAELSAFMMEPSRLVALPCTEIDCESSVIRGVEPNVSDEGAFDFEVLRYARNEVVYRITLPARSLVVENETFAPGWSGDLSPGGGSMRPARVDGALRGWVLPAGVHRLHLRYETPRFETGLAVSAASIVLWLGVVLFQISRRRRDQA